MTAMGRYQAKFTDPAAGIELPIGSSKEGNEKGQGYLTYWHTNQHIFIAITKVTLFQAKKEARHAVQAVSLFPCLFLPLLLPLVRRPRRSESIHH